MIIGYARVSTTNQKNGMDHQLDLLQEAGAEKVFSESVSSVADRPEFAKAIDHARSGDVFVVTTLSRFARSISDLWKNVELLSDKGVALKILDMNLDTQTPTGKLLLSLMGSIYQFERELLLERQAVGIAKAKAAGKFKGRMPTARKKAKKIQSMTADGFKPSEIAKELGIGVASVYRYRNP